MDVIYLVLATFWAWETLRFAVENYASGVFAATRVIHPFLVASLPLYVLWPHWVAALAVAGAVGVLVAVFDRVFNPPSVSQIPSPQRRSRGGLPPLP